MRRTKRLALVAPLALVAVALSACGGSSGGGTPQASGPPSVAATGASGGTGGATASAPTSGGASASTGGGGAGTADVTDVPVKAGGTFTGTIEKDITDFNTLTSEGNTFDTSQVMNAIYPYVFNVDPNLKIFLNADMMDSVEQTSMSPQTIVYKIKPAAKWSDGVDINSDDFKFNYDAQSGKNDKYTPATTTGYASIDTFTASPDKKTVTLTFKKGEEFPDWKSLFGPLLPAHEALKLKSDPVQAFNTAYLAPSYPKISGGPYVITDFKSNTSVSLKRNDAYYGPKAPFDTLIWRIITDSAQEPTALANGEVNYIYPQPQVDLVKQVQAIQGLKTDIGFGLIFEHIDLNLGNEFLKEVALRRAIFTATNRDNLLNATVKQFSDKAAVLNNRMLVPGQDGYQDNSDGLGQGKTDDAKKILTDAGYKGVGSALMTPGGKPVAPLRFRYTEGNTIRQQTGQLFAADLKKLGIDVQVVSTPKLGQTLDKKDFDAIVFAWVATPFPYSANKVLYVTKGGSNYDNYSNPVTDAALKAAALELDPVKAQKDLNDADLQISKDAVTLPLYQKPTYLAFQDKFGNIRNNSTQIGPTYNVQAWGLL